MRAHFDFGLTVQNRGSAYLHEIYDCERRNVRYDIFDQGLSCGRTKNQPKSTYNGFTIVNLMHFEQLLPLNRYGHATPRGPGSGVRGPGRWGSRHTPRGSKPHQPRDKEKSPEEGLLFGRSGTVRGMTVPARRVERKDTGLLEQSISCYLFCVKNNLAKGLFTMRFCRDTESADPERCGTALCKKGCEQLCSRAVERLTRLLDDLLGKARHPHAGMIG